MSDHKYRRNGNIEWGGKGGGLKNAQKCIIVLRFMAKIVVSEIEGLMSIYYDWRFEECFLHLQMLLAFPYLIFKSRSAIRKVGLYTREYVVVTGVL